MALSSSESELLTQTCENMNVAANTCREVLEMLRSLGNTGVVDIATHNNANSAHDSASNLAKINSSGALVLGNAGDIQYFSNYVPWRVEKHTSTNSYRLYQLGETKGIYNSYLQNRHTIAMTNASGEIASTTNLPDYIPNIGRKGFYQDVYAAVFSDTSLNVSVAYYLGTYSDTTLYDKVYCCLDLTGGYLYGFDHTAFFCLGTASVGLSAHPFDTAYFRTAATVTSDRREKSGISAIGSEAVDFIKTLRPVQYTVKAGRQNVLETDETGHPTKVEDVPGTRRHWGLIAQEVQEALVSAGYDPSDCAVWSLADKNDPDSRQALRYEELIAPMIKVIQQQQERIEALERKVA